MQFACESRQVIRYLIPLVFAAWWSSSRMRTQTTSRGCCPVLRLPCFLLPLHLCTDLHRLVAEPAEPFPIHSGRRFDMGRSRYRIG